MAVLGKPCSSRACARTSWKRRTCEREVYVRRLARLPGPFAFLTFTTEKIRPHPDEVTERVLLVKDAIGDLRRRRFWTKNVVGARWHIEASGNFDGINVHAHMLAVGLDAGAGATLESLWEDETKGVGRVVDAETCRSADDAAWRLVYAAKGVAYLDAFDSLGEDAFWGSLRTRENFTAWALALARRRNTRLSDSSGLVRGDEDRRAEATDDDVAADDAKEGTEEPGEDEPGIGNVVRGDTIMPANVANATAALSPMPPSAPRLLQCGICRRPLEFRLEMLPAEFRDMREAAHWTVALRSARSAATKFRGRRGSLAPFLRPLSRGFYEDELLPS